MRHDRIRIWLHFTTLLIALLTGSGCLAPKSAPLPPDQQAQFRAETLDFLVQSATSDEPVLRMQAIEALQDVAPREGLRTIVDNVDNGYAGVSFAALMALGTMRDKHFISQIRTRAEDADPNVRIAALFALHRIGHPERTGELGNYLMTHRDARVRANAALAIGRLGETKSIKLLSTALRREKKDAVKMQIEEALAMLGDNHGTERLLFYGYSAVPDQAALGVMLLANAHSPDAEELFRHRLQFADQPEIKLQAARGLGYLGHGDGYELALAYLRFNSPDMSRRNDPPAQQVHRIRALAALALEAIGDPAALGALQRAFHQDGQAELVKVAVARAAISLIDRRGRTDPLGYDEPRQFTAGPGEDR